MVYTRDARSSTPAFHDFRAVARSPDVTAVKLRLSTCRRCQEHQTRRCFMILNDRSGGVGHKRINCPQKGARWGKQPGGAREETGGGREKAGGAREETGGGRKEAGGAREETGGGREKAGGAREETGGSRKEAGGAREETGGSRKEAGGAREETGTGRKRRGKE
ncbi:hypothetical protein EYF80_056256 [Liparis tanakae]|uniref:Uncharacterized protein n=1 Tax=Liparis tanakae TaxID=230148 RepID=A0A4Z2EZC5_9TELE|nr:hypothetical protein EYF80_056256 [Liparis tanakae]